MINVAQKNAKQTFADAEASKKNGCFQTKNELEIDLSAYAGAEGPIQIYVCAVNAANPQKVSVLCNIKNIVLSE